MIIWQEDSKIKAASRPISGTWTLGIITPTISATPSPNLRPEHRPIAAANQNIFDAHSQHKAQDRNSKSADIEVNESNRAADLSRDVSPRKRRRPFLKKKVTDDQQLTNIRKWTSSNAIDAPSGGALSGAQIGFAAGTAAPSNGLAVSGSLVMNSAALATNATDGFIYESTCAGPPTGTPTSQSGRAALIIDTTANTPYFYNDTSPTAVPGGWAPANGMVLISKQILASTQTIITFSSIPQTYNHLKMILVSAINTTISDNQLKVNGISTGYDYITWFSNGATTTNSATSNSVSFNIGPSWNNTNTVASFIEVDFPGYTLTTFRHPIRALAIADDPAVIGYIQFHAGNVRSTAAISTIQVTAGAGSYVVGTAAYLYGIN
ncbi:MAG: hypothetical protein V4487_05475 [Chlamydiota bacterium]